MKAELEARSFTPFPPHLIEAADQPRYDQGRQISKVVKQRCDANAPSDRSHGLAWPIRQIRPRAGANSRQPQAIDHALVMISENPASDSRHSATIIPSHKGIVITCAAIAVVWYLPLAGTLYFLR